MNREERAAKAVELKHGGYNCCQAVACAFADKVNMDEAQLKQIGLGFGGGMATMDGTCGALCGAIMVNSLAADPKLVRGNSKFLVQNFNELCGATICKELKGIGTGIMLCSCDDCVKNATLLTADLFEDAE
ncbi:MAG: C_GCAxxG_C_C family protein [Clostridiales bacterium]|nr:C_GCAxxG_C_C family protein [Clostridiales bacterium]